MKSLVITVEASRDLSAISDYFLEQSVDAGDRTMQDLSRSGLYRQFTLTLSSL